MHAPWQFCHQSQHYQQFELMMADVHKGCEDCGHGSNVNQIAEQAVLAKNALGSAEHAGNNCSSSDGVEVRDNIRSAKVLVSD
jgi:hypothetical protein